MFNTKNWEIKTTSNGTQKTKAENSYCSVIVKTKNDQIIVIKNLKSVGTFMADNKNVFRQRDAQETIPVDSFEAGIEMAKNWFTEMTEKCNAKLRSATDKFEAISLEKNYKPGWVWYQMKECYGSDLASEFVSK